MTAVRCFTDPQGKIYTALFDNKGDLFCTIEGAPSPGEFERRLGTEVMILRGNLQITDVTLDWMQAHNSAVEWGNK